MITEKDLQAAIAECQGQRNPNANTCIKLASFYTIQDHLFPKTEAPSYSYAVGANTVSYNSESEFGQLIYGKDSDTVFKVMDELMEAVEALNPRLYASVLRKLE